MATLSIAWLIRISPFALLAVSIIESVSVVVLFALISPNLGDAIAMVAIGLFAVVFKVQGRLRGRKGLWFLGASLTFFAWLNLFLTITTANLITDDQLQEPDYVADARIAAKSSQKHVQDLRDAQLSATSLAYSNSLTTQIKEAEGQKKSDADALKTAEDQYKKELQSKEIRGIDVFERIPRLIEYSLRSTTSWVTRIGIFILFLVGIGLGLFVETVMISIAQDALGGQNSEFRKSMGTLPIEDGENTIDQRTISTALSSNVQQAFTNRQYIIRGWPKQSSFIVPPETVAKETGWPLEECQAVHQRVFAPICQENQRGKLVPTIDRDVWLRSRRAK